MTDIEKAKILVSIENGIKTTTKQINEKIIELNDFADKLRKGLLTWYKGSEDTEVITRGIAKAHEEIAGLKIMAESPYFFKTKVSFADENTTREIFISKYSLPEQQIYSWVSPIARLRYAPIGEASYQRPKGEARKCIINKRENYLIRNAQVYQVSYETAEQPKIKLVNKPLSEDSRFGLTEIIEKLDAYQDDIIRLDPDGSLLISGPAGSGKTTLALHRMSFLRQNPDTAYRFPVRGMTIFVQDEATKKYFASILPSLTLKGVTITTFAEWAFKLLGLNMANKDSKSFAYSENSTHEHQSLLIYAKHQALRRKTPIVKLTNIYDSLSSAYFDYFDAQSFAAFKQQQASRILDRFDLSLLLTAALGEVKTKDLKQLIVVDEAENYLPGQLSLIKRHLDPSTGAIIYIGDLVQQTFPFAMKHWEQINENFNEGKKIVIPKVYRISEEIRDYLISKGYEQDISSTLEHGPKVEEIKIAEVAKLSNSIQAKIDSIESSKSLGVITNSPEALIQLQNDLKPSERLHVLSIQEAQGVEFDSVILVFSKRENYPLDWPQELIRELVKVERDLFLVGVTRAKKELQVCLI